MRLRSVEIVKRSVDNKVICYAEADYWELFKLERKNFPIDLFQWVILDVFPNEEEARAFCKQKGLRLATTPPTSKTVH